MSAAAKLLARRANALLDAVGDDAQTIVLSAGTESVRSFNAHRAKIAVAAGHGDDLAAIEKARRADQPVLDGSPQTVVAATYVPHSREATVESVPKHANGVRGMISI